MVRRRRVIMPIVALAITGLGGPTASSAPAAQSASDSGAAATAAGKRKSVSLRSLDARLRATERNLVGARRQLKVLQRAASAILTGLNPSLGGASGGNPLTGDLSALNGLDLDNLQQQIAAAAAGATGAATASAAPPTQSLGDMLADPATLVALDTFLTSAFGVTPAQIGQTLAQLAPQVVGGIVGLTAREQPVVMVKLENSVAGTVYGTDLPDDLNPQTVTGSVAVRVPNGTSNKPIALLAGVRTAEGDTPAAKVQLDMLEVDPLASAVGFSVSGGSGGAGLPVKGSRLLPISGASKLARTADADAQPDLNLAAAGSIASILDAGIPSPLSVTNTSGAPRVVMVRFTARFIDESPAD